MLVIIKQLPLVKKRSKVATMGSNNRIDRVLKLFLYEGGSKEMILQSTIKCPECGFKKEETMPTDSCQFFYECINCKTLLKPKQGDCCVFCSYGSVKCPPKQKEC